MKKIILAIATIATLNGVSQELYVEKVPWNHGEANGVTGLFSSRLSWDATVRKFNFDGDWKRLATIATHSSGDLLFVTQNSHNYSNSTLDWIDNNNKISGQDFMDKLVKMKLHSHGALSLGTLSAKAKLTINGTFGGGKSLLMEDNGRAVYFQTQEGWSATQANGAASSIDFGMYWTDNLSSGVNRNAGFVIAPSKSSYGLRINKHGNVSIGTNRNYSNNYGGELEYFKLSVNGPLRSKEIIVDAGWADYVFDASFELKKLSEVESYIEQNNHLPDVPAGSEIEKNGLDLGKMQTIHMQKIEELTLYTIQQEKMIEAQNSLMLKMEKRLLKLEQKLAKSN